MKTPLALSCTLILLAGSLGAPAPTDPSPDLDALRLALDGPGFIGLAPDPTGAPVLHAAYAPGATVPDASGLVPVGWSLVVHHDAEVGTLALPVDREDLSKPMSDGTPPVPADARGIGPGSPLLIDRPDGLFICTANYIFESSGTYYLGAAGHCFLPSDRNATHGTGADFDPTDPGTKVTVEVCIDFCYFGGQLIGLFADMQVLGNVTYARQLDAATGEEIGWDFGVVEIPASLEEFIRTSMPVFHGPTGQNGTEATSGFLAHYGNGIDFGTSHATKGRVGLGLNDGIDESIQMSVFINGGDSGSAINKAVVTTAGDVYEGREALGIITHGIVTGGVPLGWGTSIDQAIEMADDDANLPLTLQLPPRWG